jgi:7 transmembrane helices usually fused to an inactive transglutaminase/Transglutaminase-like superfamily
MSRTALCVVTAGLLVALSLGLMLLRRQVLGGDVKAPTGADGWKVTMVVQGRSDGDAKLLTVTPLDFGRQHVLYESCRSAELLDRPPDARHPERRQMRWVQRAGGRAGPFRARYEFECVTDVHRPTPAMDRLHRTLYAAPRPGEYLDVNSRDDTDQAAITAAARRLTVGLERPLDEAQALFHFVDEDIAKEPTVHGPSATAAECLESESGDSRARSRLLVALLRNRGIPARMVTGLTLTKGPEQAAHYWVEAWVHDHWLPMCPAYHRFGHVPATYLVLGLGDLEVARGPGNHARDLSYAFLVERVPAAGTLPSEGGSWLHHLLAALSFSRLPPTEQRLVEFLLLLPVAALIICLFRNVIGLNSFGTFAPALVGLCFRDLHTLPGLLVFVSIILVGWVLRRVLDYFHLLQVPRVAFMLSLVVLVLISAIVAASYYDVEASRYISLFPMVILTGMIERFWTLETEDGTASSFRTLLSTIVIAGTIALVLSFKAVVDLLFRYPETLGLIMAAQLLLGRYTGYRLTELFRFRDFVQPENHADAG